MQVTARIGRRVYEKADERIAASNIVYRLAGMERVGGCSARTLRQGGPIRMREIYNFKGYL
jgi:hypothetical protein